MNIEVCKKCKYKPKQLLCLSSLNNISENEYLLYVGKDREVKKFEDLCTIFIKGNALPDEKWQIDFNKIFDMDKSDVMASKYCPYYMEHEISEWNKKEN